MRRLGVGALALLALVGASPQDSGSPSVPPARFQALRYRNVGPTRGGRATAVAGVRGQPHTFYQGTAGGVWKTVNAGQSWRNLSDGFFTTGSIGAIAVSELDPNVVYVGTGQATLRGNVSPGDGVYKSTDGGQTWRNVGLGKVGQIARVRIHPRDPERVYVAAVGNAFVPNEDRGLFRSRDGGASWEKVLYVSPKTGIVDLALDPLNPRVLYAAAWTGQRKPWTIVSGSAESGLYKSADGGDTWRRLEGGLPTGVVGKIGVSPSPVKAGRVWAIVEAEPGGLFRSDDAGETWKRVAPQMTRKLIQRAWYYMHVFADPRDADTVYVLNVQQWRSRDGGASFEQLKNVPHGDGHDLWIDPDDPRILAYASDGGTSVSLDDGETWSTLLNQPTAEIYYVEADDRFPYRLYGAQQDNTTISISSRAPEALTREADWLDVGGCEDGHIAFDPKHPEIVYAGCYGGEITRTNVTTGETRFVLTYPQMEIGRAPKDLRYRFNWNAPIRVSRHDPRVLFHCSQVVHRSRNEGQSWEVISPDLSRNDKSKQDYSGEPITKENTGVEVYANILAFEESPLAAGLFWAGSDDGLVHVSRDHGKTWTNVTPQALPEWSAVNIIEASPHDPARAFIAAYKYKLGDPRPSIFRTDDYGKTWARLTNGQNGIRADLPTRVVREDPRRKGLLYAGTEAGTYVSFDDGARWQSLQLNLPIVPINDLELHDDDLLVATQGRSFWILDDVTPLRAAALPADWRRPRLLTPREAYRVRQDNRDTNPPAGAMLHYWLPETPRGELALEVLDGQGRRVERFSSERPPHRNPEFPYRFMGRYAGDRKLTKNVGLNRFLWDLRHPVVDFPPGTIVWGFLGGPRAVPGTYSVRLTLGDWSEAVPLEIRKDPRLAATPADLQAHLDLMLRIRAALDRTYEAVRKIRSVREQAQGVIDRVQATGLDAAALQKARAVFMPALDGLEGELMQPRNEADQDTENFPSQLDNQLAYVYMWLDAGDARPTDGDLERIGDLEKELAALEERLARALGGDVAAFEKLAVEHGAGRILLPRPVGS